MEIISDIEYALSSHTCSMIQELLCM